MARFKNALTEHYIGAIPANETDEVQYLRLASRILEVNPSGQEDTEDYSDYAGDGTISTDVTGVRKAYDFVGQTDSSDAAQQFVAAREFDINDRRVMYRQVRTDGTIFEGEATLSAIEIVGGVSSDYQPFNCTLTWVQTPTITLPEPPTGP